MPDRAHRNSTSAKLREILESDDHRWYLGKIDQAEAARRKKAAEGFKTRHDR